MSIAQGVIDIVLQHATGKVKTIRVRIGRMTEILPDSLRFCFEAIREDTVGRDAELVIEEVPVRCSCLKCNSEFELQRFIMICPNCSATELEILSGNELEVVELEEEPLDANCET